MCQQHANITLLHSNINPYMEDYHTSYHLNKHTLKSLIKQKLLLKMIELAQDLTYSIDSRSLVSKSLIPCGKKKKKKKNHYSS